MASRILVALAVASAGLSCDNGAGTRRGSPGATSVSINGRRWEVTLVLTEKERRHGPETFAALPEGHGYLLAWPRERAMKLEPQYARSSFTVVFMDRQGKIVDVKLFAEGDREGIVPAKDAAYALLLRPGLMRKPPFKAGDTAEFSEDVRSARPEELPVMTIGGHKAYVELALVEAERQQGLMFRPRMSPEDGMLFVYEEDGPRQFWMGNTLIPLDIAFFRSDGTFVNLNETPTYPDPRKPPVNYATSDSDGPARFVLEMNLGWFRRKGLLDDQGKLKAGTKVEFPPEALGGAFDK